MERQQNQNQTVPTLDELEKTNHISILFDFPFDAIIGMDVSTFPHTMEGGSGHKNDTNDDEDVSYLTFDSKEATTAVVAAQSLFRSSGVLKITRSSSLPPSHRVGTVDSAEIRHEDGSNTRSSLRKIRGQPSTLSWLPPRVPKSPVDSTTSNNRTSSSKNQDDVAVELDSIENGRGVKKEGAIDATVEVSSQATASLSAPSDESNGTTSSTASSTPTSTSSSTTWSMTPTWSFSTDSVGISSVSEINADGQNLTPLDGEGPVASNTERDPKEQEGEKDKDTLETETTPKTVGGSIDPEQNTDVNADSDNVVDRTVVPFLPVASSKAPAKSNANVERWHHVDEFHEVILDPNDNELIVDDRERSDPSSRQDCKRDELEHWNYLFWFLLLLTMSVCLVVGLQHMITGLLTWDRFTSAPSPASNELWNLPSEISEAPSFSPQTIILPASVAPSFAPFTTTDWPSAPLLPPERPAGDSPSDGNVAFIPSPAPTAGESSPTAMPSLTPLFPRWSRRRSRQPRNWKELIDNALEGNGT